MRELFPYKQDRAVVRAFLRGKRPPRIPSGEWITSLTIKNGNILNYAGTTNLAWIAAGDGSLYAKLTPPGARVRSTGSFRCMPARLTS